VGRLYSYRAMSLEVISCTSKSVISLVAQHKCGVPLISNTNSILSEQEQEYLYLHRQLTRLNYGIPDVDDGSEQVDELFHRLGLSEVVLNKYVGCNFFCNNTNSALWARFQL
jgi:hypothetical protein